MNTLEFEPIRNSILNVILFSCKTESISSFHEAKLQVILHVCISCYVNQDLDSLNQIEEINEIQNNTVAIFFVDMYSWT